MNKIAIRVNQRWQSKRSPDYQILVTGKKGSKFNVKVLTDKPNVYKDTHKLSQTTFYSKFELMK